MTSSDPSDDWYDQARTNIYPWGNQTAPILLLAAVEEQGEIADAVLTEAEDVPTPPEADERAVKAWDLIDDARHLGKEVRQFLESNFEAPAGGSERPDERDPVRQSIGGTEMDDPDAVQDEVDDLAPLLLQLTWELDAQNGQTDGPGIWVRDPSHRWHRSTTFDGYDHGLACGLTLPAGDDVTATQMDTDTRPEKRTCDVCREYWRTQDHE